jgi:putative ABC transport system substrate-binding protein
MRRRDFLCAALLTGLSSPAARAQQAGKIARIGYLSVSTVDLDKSWLAAFRAELRKLGYVEGQSVVIEQRHAAGHADKLAALAADLLAQKPDVMVVYGAWHVADKLRVATPVVVTVVPDPVAQGVVTNLARPGGNITGFSDAHAELVPKRLELIREIAPAVKRVAVLYYRSSMALQQLKTAQAAAPAQAMSLLPVAVKGPQPEEIERAFALMAKESAGAVLVIAEPTLGVNRKLIADLAIKYRLIAVGTVRTWADSGFLMSYGTNFHDLWRRSAVYVDKILKGTKPGDLPIEQPTKFDLVINQRTAKAIGVEVPRALLLRADQVIE